MTDRTQLVLAPLREATENLEGRTLTAVEAQMILDWIGQEVFGVEPREPATDGPESDLGPVDKWLVEQAKAALVVAFPPTARVAHIRLDLRRPILLLKPGVEPPGELSDVDRPPEGRMGR